MMFLGFETVIFGLKALATAFDPEHSSAYPISAAFIARSSFAGRQAVNFNSSALSVCSTTSYANALLNGGVLRRLCQRVDMALMSRAGQSLTIAAIIWPVLSLAAFVRAA